ncbi:unnamed protein product [Vitrella brassicaformis CCMP3155]|uniref:MYND-type domain-containing protein n=1 Tax=Vitrella brassicaformis (strain CCMP3155) TaxID=1169540 RepID=A0A0G4EUS9_VITBC|nr:unnamed protein product [Vitrella brassicaformis CCMP3155]|eukprot:CEM02355.1 unnamed protein product [Vitrella brassicaformis CCMP3155]
MARPIDYSKWDDIACSDDEDDAKDAPHRLPYSSDEISGYKVRQNAPKNDYPKRCAAMGCTATAPAGSPMPMCQQCSLVHYCSKQCQVDDWRRRHRKECKSAQKEFSRPPLHHNRAAVMFIYGWLDEDAFFSLQRGSQQEILREFVTAGQHSGWLMLRLRQFHDRSFCVVGLHNPDNPQGSRPRCAYTTGEDGAAIYPCFMLAPVARRGAEMPCCPRNPKMLVMLEAARRTLKTAIETCMKDPRHRVFPVSFVTVTDACDTLFWRKEVVITEMWTSSGLQNRVWYLRPSIDITLSNALMEASYEVFGHELGQILAERWASCGHRIISIPEDYLRREAWQRNLVNRIATDGGAVGLDAICEQKAWRQPPRPCNVRVSADGGGGR